MDLGDNIDNKYLLLSETRNSCSSQGWTEIGWQPCGECWSDPALISSQAEIVASSEEELKLVESQQGNELQVLSCFVQPLKSFKT